MNNGMTNLVIGTSTGEGGFVVVCVVRNVDSGKVQISYEHTRLTRIERTDIARLEAAAEGKVARLV